MARRISHRIDNAAVFMPAAIDFFVDHAVAGLLDSPGVCAIPVAVHNQRMPANCKGSVRMRETISVGDATAEIPVLPPILSAGGRIVYAVTLVARAVAGKIARWTSFTPNAFSLGPLAILSAWTMLNERLKSSSSAILPRVQTPAQYVGGELNVVRKDHRPGARQALPGVSRHLHARHEPPRPAGALHADEQPAPTGPASGPSRPGSTSRPQLRAAEAAALQPGNVHAAAPVRRARLHAPVRDLLHATS